MFSRTAKIPRRATREPLVGPQFLPLAPLPASFRLQVVGELATLGYNVMSSDLDIAYTRSPYSVLKAGPLARFNLIMRQARADPPNPPSFRND